MRRRQKQWPNTQRLRVRPEPRSRPTFRLIFDITSIWVWVSGMFVQRTGLSADHQAAHLAPTPAAGVVGEPLLWSRRSRIRLTRGRRPPSVPGRRDEWQRAWRRESRLLAHVRRAAWRREMAELERALAIANAHVRPHVRLR